MPADPTSEPRARRRRPKRGRLLAQRIVDDICELGLVDGDRLPPEAVLMQTYNAGRSTFREALRILEANGVVRVQPGPGGGPVVSGADAPDLADTLMLHLQVRRATYEDVAGARVLIEPYLARLAAERRDPTALDHLRAVMADIEAADLDDKATFNALDGEFQRALGQGSGNRVVDLLGTLLVEIYDQHFFDVAEMPVSERADVVRWWRRITDDILDGRADDAERHVRRMIEYTTSRFSSQYPKESGQSVRWGELHGREAAS